MRNNFIVPRHMHQVEPAAHASDVTADADDAPSLRSWRGDRAEPLVDAVAENKAAVKGADPRVGGGDEVAVEVDDHFGRVSRILNAEFGESDRCDQRRTLSSA